tara:strand:+ start:116 stop:841 length:726 start_codon:yes stop_codon:yes gene_type:complete
MTLLNYIPSKYKPKSEMYNKEKMYNYPFILKPMNCSRNSFGVKLIKNYNDLKNYFNKYEMKNTMYQEFIDTEYEVGILYERNPFKKNGKIISIIQRKFLGGERFTADLNTILNGIKNNEIVDRNNLITQKLNKVIDHISKKIPNFFVGRYDVRCKNLQDLKDAKNFYVLEINGSMGFDLAKDSNFSLLSNLKIKFIWLLKRIYYGLLNILKLNCVNPYVIILAIKKAIECKDWQKNFSRGL